MNKFILLTLFAATFFRVCAKVDTVYVNSLEEFERGLTLEEIKSPQPVQYSYLSESDRRRSNLLSVGGTYVIINGVGLLPAGATVGFIGLVVDEYETLYGLVALGGGMMALGVVGIVGGVKMIRKGKQIRRQNRRLSFNPYINPLENSYGANFSFQF